MTPDVYSGFAIAGTVASFIHSRRPYTIAGTSHHSIGASVNGSSSSSGVAQKFLSEDNLPYHSDIVQSRSTPACVIECFLQAQDHLPLSQDFKLDMRQLLFKMMEEAAPKTQDFYTDVKDAVLKMGELHNIKEVAQKAIEANPNLTPRKPTVRNIVRAGLSVALLFMIDIYRGRFHLDCSSLSIKNIYDASLLCDNILRLKDINILGFSTILKSSLTNIKRIIVKHGNS